MDREVQFLACLLVVGPPDVLEVGLDGPYSSSDYVNTCVDWYDQNVNEGHYSYAAGWWRDYKQWLLEQGYG